MTKTNHETMQPEAQAGEGLKLDVTVRPIAPVGNLLAFANVTIGDCFKIDGFRICSGENGLYVNMPSTQDKQGKWRDVCWPVTADFRRQLMNSMHLERLTWKPTRSARRYMMRIWCRQGMSMPPLPHRPGRYRAIMKQS